MKILETGSFLNPPKKGGVGEEEEEERRNWKSLTSFSCVWREEPHKHVLPLLFLGFPLFLLGLYLLGARHTSPGPSSPTLLSHQLLHSPLPYRR